MSDTQLTKKALAYSMKQLMEVKPMKKISISDIVEGCSMNRQSFYYHFKDKYDLVNWIFYTELVITLKDLPLGNLEILEAICEYFYSNKTFYKNAFEVKGQNSFSEYFGEVIHAILKSQLSELFKSNKEVDFYATFYADAIKVSIERWLREDAKISPERFTKLLIAAVEIGGEYLSREDT